MTLLQAEVMDYGTLGSEFATKLMGLEPLLHITSGTRFGYRTSLARKQAPQCLVEVTSEILVGPGLHLLVAPNGSGKTTFLRTLAGLSPVLEGRFRINAQVHYFADELRVDPQIKARTFFNAWFKGKSFTAAEKLADILHLSLTKPIGKLSRGNRQKVLLIFAEVKAAQSDACLLLMDEPLAGLDAETREQVTQLWADAQTRITRLVIMHELECVQKADSLLTIAHTQLCQATARLGATWMETYRSLQS